MEVGKKGFEMLLKNACLHVNNNKKNNYLPVNAMKHILTRPF